MAGNMGEKGREIADDGHGIRGAPADHILPYNHSQPVAVVIPARRFYFYVFAHHVEAQPLHGANIKNQSLIGRGGIEAVRPIALVQHSVKEIGFVV